MDKIRIKFETDQSKQRRKAFDHSIGLLLRYLPLTVFMAAGLIYFLVKYSLSPESYQDQEIVQAHGKRLYALAIGFIVMSWSCIIYYFKGNGAFKNYGRWLILLSSFPIIYEVVMHFDKFVFGLLIISFYWLKFAFKPHGSLR
ncbi:hypothetical protein [Acinetobacter sp. WCHAc060025]|uniref:hypothetical protein n=1 Tax=Acinetobacter sp. WCHAc060025 TaxID=2518625 RepID=UPI0010236C82|nr:hypothetical protein [Acinetobacter sp. WCHAc060025]RZG74379.1 hypothetical protein EXE09_13450 [Acinetobacter sp. WCHAc060025]